MNEQDLTRIMNASVALACRELSNEELAVLNNVAQMDLDPHGRLFDYTKVAALFTENGGTRMHAETKHALAAIVLRRLTP